MAAGLRSRSLDQVVYPRLLVRWAGNSALIRPGESWAHAVDLADFLPVERSPQGKLSSPAAHM